MKIRVGYGRLKESANMSGHSGYRPIGKTSSDEAGKIARQEKYV